MYVLAIETTGAFASVALMKDNDILGVVHGHDKFSHLQNLMPQVERVLAENELSLGDADVIAVSRGPGSFTGIRIGVSSVRALSQVTGIPCVGVSSLEALAMRADADGLICPMLDARRSQVYAGGYVLENGFPRQVIEAAPYTVEEFMDKIKAYDQIVILGDGADAYEGAIKELRPVGVTIAPPDTRYQDATTVARLGKREFELAGGMAYEQLKPDYMRLAEAERKLKEKQKV